jgi:site-specific recombinase XerD
MKNRNNKRRRPKGHAAPYIDGAGFRYEATWKDKNGKEILIDGKSVTSKGRGSTPEMAINTAEANLNAKVAKLNALTIPKEHLLVADLCQFWLDDHKSQISYNTNVGYQRAIDGFIRPILSSVSITTLSTSHVMKIYSKIRESGLSRSVEVQVRAVGAGACDLAKSLNYVTDNPFRNLKLRKRSHALPETFTLEEIRAIIKTADETGRLAYAILALVYGLRVSEQLALRWQDMDIESDKPTMFIREQIQRRTGQGLVRAKLKTKKCVRDIGIGPKLLKALKKLKAAQETESAVHGPQWNPEGYLFINRSGNAMDNGMEREKWRKLLADSGVEYKRRHIGRHSSALVINNGEISSKLLGHSSMQVTIDLYGHMKPGTLTESLSKAEESVFTSSQSEL